ncbi:hypothetical protein DSM112329_02876 [Paraconexibacter sp. AEG42_29]|uniref:Uncharacterized protein n=1 Tax=Paraconexibacter sp. AEG42_29 TaxID=2997339 RepID=A0AAU7AX33_9ACTN
MEPAGGLEALVHALAASGVVLEGGIGQGNAAPEAWRVFCSFAAEPMESIGDDIDDDMLSFDARVGAFDGLAGEWLVLGAGRTCSTYEDDEPYRIPMILEIACAPVAGVQPLTRSIFGCAGPARPGIRDVEHDLPTWVGGTAEWIAAAEATEAFQAFRVSGAERFQVRSDE